MTLPLRQYWRLLARHIRPQWLRFSLLAVLLLGNIGLQIYNPQIMRHFLDAALAGEPMRVLLWAAVAFTLLALLQQGVAIAVVYLGENVAWTATNALRAELAEHALNLGMDYHNQHTPGEMIERIDGDAAELAMFFSQFAITLAGNVLLLVGILAAVLREDWRAGLAFIGFAALAMWAISRVRGIAVRDQKRRRQAEANLFGFVEEQLSGAEDIRASGAVDHSLRRLLEHQAEVYRHDQIARYKSTIIHVVTAVMTSLGLVVAMLSGYFLYRLSAITLGTVYLFIYYINELEAPLWTLTRQMESFQTISACIERITELREMKPLVQEGAMPSMTAGALAVDFDGVSFAYPDGVQVISDVSFHLAPGRVMGLLGRTGSGKTTLTRLLMRLYDPTNGHISLGGQDLRGFQLNALRQGVAMVTQEVQLFQASVRDNLTFFDNTVKDEQILAAIELLELGEWFSSLPEGLDTMLNTGGKSLSAGEAQLLAFVRVFLRSPGLVILDEASSRLDPHTEHLIERAIDRLLAGRSAMIIAHRLETVERADEILILENGRGIEAGARAALAADPDSKFAALLRTGLQEALA